MKKYWIIGFVLICLWVATLFAKSQPYKGTQWEYGHYLSSVRVELVKPITIEAQWSWKTSTGILKEVEEVHNLWRKAGFDFGDKKVEEIHWFNFLGSQGWELVTAEIYEGDGSKEHIIKRGNFWFKRPN